MRRIVLQEPDSNAWRQWRTDCQRETETNLARASRGEKVEFTSLYKRKSIKNALFGKKGPFHGKCAYCETFISDFQHGDVEHFRPKGGVTDENDKPVARTNDLGDTLLDENGMPVFHPGYYWLAYDWRNLLPSCVVCNQPKVIGNEKIGKRNRFPVDGLHAQRPEETAAEKPLLINPASGNPKDDPGLHFIVDTCTGLLGHRTRRGEACIKILGLNFATSWSVVVAALAAK